MLLPLKKTAFHFALFGTFGTFSHFSLPYPPPLLLFSLCFMKGKFWCFGSRNKSGACVGDERARSLSVYDNLLSLRMSRGPAGQAAPSCLLRSSRDPLVFARIICMAPHESQSRNMAGRSAKHTAWRRASSLLPSLVPFSMAGLSTSCGTL